MTIALGCGGTDRYIDQEHWSRIGTSWYCPLGALFKQPRYSICRRMTAGDDGATAGGGGARSRRANLPAGITVLLPIAIFDIAGPLVVQSTARSHGASLTGSLALSGIPPAAWIVARGLWRRRLDAVGVFVLTSISLATLIGLATGSGKLYLLDGAILTGVFGLVCLGSLATPRPLMFHFALETMGGLESPKGREFDGLRRYAEFRRVFVVMTVVWGAGFVLQAAINVAIIEATSTQKAFVINKILPYVFLAILGAWTAAYAIVSKRRGEAAARRAA